mgnify:CR=1 FL=1
MNTPQDPETGKFVAKTPDPSLAEAMMAIAEALKTVKAGDADAGDKLAGIEQFLLRQEQTRPHENTFNPPMISSLNPLGERDHPRPDLKCKMIWVGFKITKECLTREEIELLNRLVPGDYRVTKADGRSIPFRVDAKYADSGKLEHLSCHFPCKMTEDRQNHGSMTAYLREALGEAVTPVSLHAEITALKAQLAAATGGHPRT